MTIQPGQDIGRYHIIDQLGRGGMATVYKAFDPHLERVVAIKVIRHQAVGVEHAEEMRRRFQREAKALSKLSHPNIVHVYDYGEFEGSPYLVMEYIPGGSLKDRLTQPMPWVEAAGLLAPIAQALEFAHQLGIIHRDIKPHNILLTTQGQPMLSDFGIAKIIGADETTQLTATGLGIGTPEYMAPEQWQGQSALQTDIYSLGIVFFEMVAGKRPYTADTPAAVLIKQVNDPLPRPKQFVPGIPDAVEQVLFKALMKNPQDRYATMSSFRADLQKLSLGQQISEETTKQIILPKWQPPSMPPIPPPMPSMQTLPGAAPSTAILSRTPLPAIAASEHKPLEPAGAKPPTAEAPAPVKRRRIFLWLVVGVVALVGIIILCMVGASILHNLVAPTQVAETLTQAAALIEPTQTQARTAAPTTSVPAATGTRLPELSPSSTAVPPTAKPVTPTLRSGTLQPTEAWALSAHADTQAEAFIHWNTADPPEVPVACAQCHSATGFADFLGADGSAAGSVEKNQPVGTVITCEACHSNAAEAISNVTFPSGITLNGIGRGALCITCHTGRASKIQVDAAVEAAGATDEDQPSTKLVFINIHYAAAGIIREGTFAQGGYEYPEKLYDTFFEHDRKLINCDNCHNPHSLEINYETCTGCHPSIKSVEESRAFRWLGSTRDYDGDGNASEGIYNELQGLGEMLYTAIQAYAQEIAGTPILYDINTFPYFFIDGNGNGAADSGEVDSANGYTAWTPRLLKAAYNYQVYMKNPASYVHGGKYVIELLYDSIDSLNQKLGKPVDLSRASRVDAGHFDGSSIASRNWDVEGVVPAACSKCHVADGLPAFIQSGNTSDQYSSDGLSCKTCHDMENDFTLYQLTSVTFPSGENASFDDGVPANLCLMCHQGRSSASILNTKVQIFKPDEVTDKLSFTNIHYAPAGVTVFGGQVKGAYEYTGKSYAGRYMHAANVDTCTSCHDAHALTLKTELCKGCHQTDDPAKIRMNLKDDYDGDGDISESIKGEVDGVKEILYRAIQDYARTVARKSIVYDGNFYPFWFNDTNNNGMADAEEINNENRFNSWTPRLLEAAYNYQYALKDPGAYIHNPVYILQILVDTNLDLGVKIKIDVKLIRP